MVNLKPLDKCYAIHNEALYECLFYERDVCTDLDTDEVMSRVKILKDLPKTEFIFKCVNSDIKRNLEDYPSDVQELLTNEI